MKHSFALAAAFALFSGLGARALAATAPLDLGSAAGFAILTGTGIFNSGATSITGDIGNSPDNVESGFGTLTLHGTDHGNDSAAQVAQNDLDTAYNDGQARSASPVAGELGGATLSPGVYSSLTDAFAVNGQLTLDGGGDPNAIFIIRAVGTLNTGPGSSIRLVNGASAGNVFWVVEGTVTLGTSTDFYGTIMADESVTLTAGASVQGRIMSQTMQVSFDGNTVNDPSPAASSSPSASPSASPSPSATLTATATPGTSPLNLGDACGFAVLAGSTITNTGLTDITGDVGCSSQSGFGQVTLSGTNHHGDPTTVAAQNDLALAYADGQSRLANSTLGTELGSTTVLPGVHNSSSGNFHLAGTLTLDAGNDPGAVFIFQMTTTLVTALNSSVSLVNGAQAKNVFWVVGSSATLGSSSSLQGSILALTAITYGTGASVTGRSLAMNAAVTLSADSVLNSFACAGIVTPSPSPSFSMSPTASPDFSHTVSPTISQTFTGTESFTLSPTFSASPTRTPSFTHTESSTPSPTRSASPTPTPSRSRTPTATPSSTRTASPSPTPSRSRTPTATPSSTRTASPTRTLSASPSPSRTATQTRTSSPARTVTVTKTQTLSQTSTPALSPSPTPLSSGPGNLPQQGTYFYPSPVRGSQGTASYFLKDSGEVTLKVYNQTGVLVDTVTESKPAGWQTTGVSAGRFASGTYYYVISVLYASGAREGQAPGKFVVLH